MERRFHATSHDSIHFSGTARGLRLHYGVIPGIRRERHPPRPQPPKQPQPRHTLRDPRPPQRRVLCAHAARSGNGLRPFGESLLQQSRIVGGGIATGVVAIVHFVADAAARCDASAAAAAGISGAFDAAADKAVAVASATADDEEQAVFVSEYE